MCCMVAVVTLGGCSRPTVEGRPALAAASGTVLYQQKPVEGATVLFIPVDHGYAATGRTDANGKFQLRTFDPDDGAAPGKFTVTVRKFEILFPPGGGEIEPGVDRDVEPLPEPAFLLVDAMIGENADALD